MIILSAGHYPKARGSRWPDPKPGEPQPDNILYEHDEAVRWVDLIQFHLREQIAVDIVPTGKVEKKVEIINEIARGNRPVLLVAEIHFNSCGGCGAKGSETLYCPGSVKGKRAAQTVQSRLGGTMRPDRGIKEGWHEMDQPGVVDYPGDVEGDEKINYFLLETDPIAIVLEPEFIHNRAMIHAYRDLACHEIALGLIQAAEALRA